VGTGNLDQRGGRGDGRLEQMAQAIISGVTHDTGKRRCDRAVPDRPGIAGRSSATCGRPCITVDMIVRTLSSAATTDLSLRWSRPTSIGPRALEKIGRDTEALGFATDEKIGRVSLIGAGRRHIPVSGQDVETLANEGGNIEMISTSTIRISCVRSPRTRVRAGVTVRCKRHFRLTRSRSLVRVGLMGETGMVGHRDVAASLGGARVPGPRERAFASPRSVGRRLPFNGAGHVCSAAGPCCFDGLEPAS